MALLNVPFLSVDDETSGLARQSWICIKRTSLAEPDRDNIANDVLDGMLPRLGLLRSREHGVQPSNLLVVVLVLLDVDRLIVFDVRGVIACRELAV